MLKCHLVIAWYANLCAGSYDKGYVLEMEKRWFVEEPLRDCYRSNYVPCRVSKNSKSEFVISSAGILYLCN